MDIGGMLTRLLPIIDYYITFFTKLITNFAAMVGLDLDALYEEEQKKDEEATAAPAAQ